MVTRRPSSDSAQPLGEEELRELFDEREQEVKALREKISDLKADGASFLSDAAHAIRSPLTVTHSYLEILHEDLNEGLTGEQRSFLGIAYENVVKLRRLVEDIVDLAALETGTAQIDLSRTAVSEVITTVHENLASTAAARGLELTTDIAEDLPPVTVDTKRLEDVLRRLVDNCVRFVPRGGSVRMTAGSDANHIVVEVADTGVGIPADRLKEALQPFVQLHRKSGENRETYGLGLALCRRQIEAFGGTLALDSDEGRGTTVTIRIPLSPNQRASTF
jgi:signal transduction histidine kinase